MKQYDEQTIYCRMLGHAVPFLYCRTTVDQTPCRKIMDCWFELLPIKAFLEEHFSPEQLEALFKPPENKMTSLLDLIEKARKRSKTPS